MLSRLLSILLPLTALALFAPLASTQSLDELGVVLHSELKPFWERFEPQKDKDDEPEMDRVVRKYEKDAIDTLDTMLDAMARVDHPGLNSHARALAWSLDRVTRTERYIERVRFVLDLDTRGRGRRRIAFVNYFKAIDLGDEAIASNDQADFEKAMAKLESAVEEFAVLEDWQSAMRASMHGAFVTQRRGLEYRWERAGWFKRSAEYSEKLAYRDELGLSAKAALETLIADGFDPDAPKPAPGTGGDSDGGTVDFRDGGSSAGDGTEGTAAATASLSSFAKGSKDVTVELKRKSNKKGLSGLSLPTFYPQDQQFVWPFTSINNDGPVAFDNQRGVVTFTPFGRRWQLSRDGVNKFLLDVDGDGETDFEFTGSAAPTLIEVPGPSKGLETPLRVCVPALNELVTGQQVNFAPTPEFARVRFQPGGWLEGKVEGEKVRLIDLNMDGKLGAPIEHFEDLTTYDKDPPAVSWWETDAMEVGRQKAISPLSSIMKIKGRWYRVALDDAAGSITTRELNLPTGAVELDYEIANLPSHLIVMESEGQLPGAVFNIMPEKKRTPVELPVGTYKIVSGVLSKGKKTSTDVARIYTGESPTFEIKAGETTKLELGAPFKLTFKHQQQGKERVLLGKTFRVFGRFGEEYARIFDLPLAPDVSARKVGGASMTKGEAMRWPGNDEYQTSSDPDRLFFFPVDLRIDNPDGSDVEMMAEQDKHPLLGGPFTSDWIR